MNSPDLSSVPRHPIRVVATRTGLAPTLLRAWERRYGVVEPGRSDGGQRLYSDEDIDRLALLKRATEGGRAIRQVAALPSERLRDLVRADRPPSGPPPGNDARIDESLVAAWRAVEAMDAEGLEQELRRAVVTLGSAAFTDGLVGPLLHTIGSRWVEGRVRPAHEHVATEVIKRVLHWMVEPARMDSDRGSVVVGTLSGERHELGALLAGATAALEGWHVTFVGHDLPAEDIALAVRTVAAGVVGISVVNGSAGEVPPQVRALRAALDPGVTVVVGGPAATELVEGVGAPGVRAVSSLAEFRDLLRELAAA